jgi:hypothetical protein
MMDIRSRAESLRPFRYFKSHRQHESEFEFAGTRSLSDETDSDGESQGGRQLIPAAFGNPSADGLPIAVVGLACRFPDADDPAALLDLVLTERRAFRRLPPGRLNVADYYSADRATPDATYSARAAVIEGWQFDLGAFGVPAPVYLAADPAHWLALETAARALAAAGFPLGQGLARSRTGVIIGNTLNGDASRAAALRLRWPYVRRVFAEALAAGDIPRERAMPVLRHAPVSRPGSAATSGSGAAVTRSTARRPRRWSRWCPGAPHWPRATSTSCSRAGWTSASTRLSWSGWPRPASWPAATCGSTTRTPPGSCPGRAAAWSC